MPRKLTFVAAGEAFLMESGAQSAPGGLAMCAAIHAVRLGHAGVPVTRVGQDDFGATLIESARTLGVNVNHIQTDPDLPTGRLWTKHIAGRVIEQTDARAAFDNLQWDHDLMDLAMRTHVLITGALARRSGQTRAELDRFVTECRTALKVLDLVNRDDAHFDRRDHLSMLGLADGVVIDRHAADIIVPSMRSASLHDAGMALLREFDLQFALALDGPTTLDILTTTESATHELPAGSAAARELVTVAALHFIAHGCDLQMTADRTAQVVVHALRDVATPLPESLLAVE